MRGKGREGRREAEEGSNNVPMLNKKLSCRRETARRFVSLYSLPSHSRSLKVI